MRESLVTAYVGLDFLGLLAHPSGGDEREKAEADAVRRLWDLFLAGRLRLVTSMDDTEIDIILWLNRQGCYVFDTLMVMEGIEAFESWGQAGADEIDRYKRIIEAFEQLDALPVAVPRDRDEPEGERALSVLFKDRILAGMDPSREEASADRDKLLIKDCLRDIRRHYSERQWQDMRGNEYGLNWAVMTPFLEARGIAASLTGREGARVRRIFGLLCRAIALSKKSSPTPEMTNDHIEFVVRTVLAKYDYRKGERYLLHLLRCARAGVPLFVSADSDLVRRVEEARPLLVSILGQLSRGLDVVSPLGIEGRLRP